jgi:hypothetical protein
LDATLGLINERTCAPLETLRRDQIDIRSLSLAKGWARLACEYFRARRIGIELHSRNADLSKYLA